MSRVSISTIGKRARLPRSRRAIRSRTLSTARTCVLMNGLGESPLGSFNDVSTSSSIGSASGRGLPKTLRTPSITDCEKDGCSVVLFIISAHRKIVDSREEKYAIDSCSSLTIDKIAAQLGKHQQYLMVGPWRAGVRSGFAQEEGSIFSRESLPRPETHCRNMRRSSSHSGAFVWMDTSRGAGLRGGSEPELTLHSCLPLLVGKRTAGIGMSRIPDPTFSRRNLPRVGPV